MGLGSSFGDQGYSCKLCGYKSTLYSPHCPSCLGKTLERVKPENRQRPGPSLSGEEVSAPPPAKKAAVLPFLAVVGVIVLLLWAFSRFSASETTVAPNRSPSAAATDDSAAEQPRAVPVRHALRTVAVHAAAPAHVHSHPAYGAVPARPAVPMKLWQVTQDGGQ